jgi:hypothetical protein
MSTFAKGRYAQAISDRSGQAFPYREMLKEWNGSFVHKSEYEKKHPQLERKAHGADPQGLQNARPARTEPAVARILNLNPLTVTTGSSTIVVFEEAHGRSSGDIVRFRDGEGNFGIQSQNINRDVGYTITVTNADNYTFNVVSDTGNADGRTGGGSISAGPVVLTP